MTNCVSLLSRQRRKGLARGGNIGKIPLVFSGKWLDPISAANLAFGESVIDH